MTDTQPAPPPLSASELDEIRYRVDAASPPPWRCEEDTALVDGPNPDKPGYTRCIAGLGRHVDADFVAHARQDVPALLAHIGILNDQLATSEAALRELAQEVVDTWDSILTVWPPGIGLDSIRGSFGALPDKARAALGTAAQDGGEERKQSVPCSKDLHDRCQVTISGYPWPDSAMVEQCKREYCDCSCHAAQDGGSSEPINCTRCGDPITDGYMIGDGDGSGRRFAHPDCWRGKAAAQDGGEGE